MGKSILAPLGNPWHLYRAAIETMANETRASLTRGGKSMVNHSWSRGGAIAAWLGFVGCVASQDAPSTEPSTSTAALSADAEWTEEELSKDRIIGGQVYAHVGKVMQFAAPDEYELKQEERKAKERAGVSTVAVEPVRTSEGARAKLANDMRGVFYFKGHEYLQVEPAWAIADAILTSQVDDRVPATTSASGTRPPEDFQGQGVMRDRLSFGPRLATGAIGFSWFDAPSA